MASDHEPAHGASSAISGTSLTMAIRSCLSTSRHLAALQRWEHPLSIHGALRARADWEEHLESLDVAVRLDFGLLCGE